MNGRNERERERGRNKPSDQVEVRLKTVHDARGDGVECEEVEHQHQARLRGLIAPS